MTVTFTQAHVNLKLGFDRANLPDVLEELDKLLADNPNKIYTVDTQFHVGSVDQADETLAVINRLFDLGAIGQYQWQELTKQIKSFKTLYLK